VYWCDDSEIVAEDFEPCGQVLSAFPAGPKPCGSHNKVSATKFKQEL
jgi:hypothetical protein